ncbi:Alpha/Beta hydrolase protein [Xylariales sp. PMI_506]|nr:Alpha/Beta hydrolase protein [Xylariales sp. PMI_506]
MVIKTLAPHGEWESVISNGDATARSNTLNSPRANVRTASHPMMCNQIPVQLTFAMLLSRGTDVSLRINSESRDNSPNIFNVDTKPGTRVSQPPKNLYRSSSRRYALFAINSTASLSHGRAYRDRLYAHWDIIDSDNTPECIKYLARTAISDGNRVGFEGSSASGYSVLQSLVRYSRVFASRVSCTSLEQAQRKMTGSTGRRSLLLHARHIAASLLLIHAERDTVVPISQTSQMKKIEDQGGEAQLAVLEGGEHSLGIPENKKIQYICKEKETKAQLSGP